MFRWAWHRPIIGGLGVVYDSVHHVHSQWYGGAGLHRGEQDKGKGIQARLTCKFSPKHTHSSGDDLGLSLLE